MARIWINSVQLQHGSPLEVIVSDLCISPMELSLIFRDWQIFILKFQNKIKIIGFINN